MYTVGAFLLGRHGMQNPPRPQVVCEACFDVVAGQEEYVGGGSVQ